MVTGEFPYIHGFSPEEQSRLVRQARMFETTLFNRIDYSEATRLLEIGSGVGAQTEILLRRFPNLHVTGVDLSAAQLAAAEQNLATTAWCSARYTLQQADATDLPFADRSFDAAYLCWVLEHMPSPARVLSELRRVLSPGAVIYVTEVLNASFFLDPYSPNLLRYWMAFNDLQYDSGGDPFIGAKLGNLLLAGGYRDVQTEVKSFHLDNRQPGKRKQMIEFWEELLLSAADQLVATGKVDTATVEGMRHELQAVRNDPNAVFFFAFVQARALVY
ncbi:class I SAM-dependent methyltransferase [Dyella telluris]|uniref:Methyltransferase domain-containing protein n=1 Tax=Dyella telluris TaxID=2763498 RepID=A0A7G8QAK9_9GAMM|nr:class I SAM-dependent methyltransferase [Dyella telluris]QNK03817.1 methyltransferase domain-containing protein [Dyella telluris]